MGLKVLFMPSPFGLFYFIYLNSYLVCTYTCIYSNGQWSCFRYRQQTPLRALSIWTTFFCKQGFRAFTFFAAFSLSAFSFSAFLRFSSSSLRFFSSSCWRRLFSSFSCSSFCCFSRSFCSLFKAIKKAVNYLIYEPCLT